MASQSYPSPLGPADRPASSYAVVDRTITPAEPPRLHWSNWFALGGAVAMFVALLAVALDLPATAMYDESAPGERVLYEGHDPMKVSNAIDSNMKYIRAATSDQPGSYNSLLGSINDSEAVIPIMAQGVGEMNGSVTAIDAGLGSVLKSTKQMGADMAVMATVSGSSAKTMKQVEQDLATLSTLMEDLYGESAQLDASLRKIEKQAAAIARDGTGAARRSTTELNTVLPDNVPPPKTSLEPTEARR